MAVSGGRGVEVGTGVSVAVGVAVGVSTTGGTAVGMYWVGVGQSVLVGVAVANGATVATENGVMVGLGVQINGVGDAADWATLASGAIRNKMNPRQ